MDSAQTPIAGPDIARSERRPVVSTDLRKNLMNRPESTSSPRSAAASGPGSRSARYHLAVFDDHLRSLPLAEGTILVGRSKHNQLPLRDDLLSRKHCSITLSGDELTLVDLNSSNGTYVNGEQVDTRILQRDDIIELGKTVLVVFDGRCWERGEGLLNLRNPVKAQKLVQRLREGSVARGQIESGPGSSSAKSKDGGVRGHKGLSESERGFLRWLERSEGDVLPQLVSDYLAHKLVSLLVRNSRTVRAAFTGVLEELMDPAMWSDVSDPTEFRATVLRLVREELAAIRAQPAAPSADGDETSARTPTADVVDEPTPGDEDPVGDLLNEPGI